MQWLASADKRLEIKNWSDRSRRNDGASAAADARATAEDVVDRETLKGFVQTAKAHLEGITDLNEIARLRVTLRTEGDWKSGETFLTILFKKGIIYLSHISG